MHQTDAANNASGLFVDPNPSIPVIGTVVDAKWLNQVQAEILNVLAFYSVPPDYSNTSQLLECLMGSEGEITGAQILAGLSYVTGSYYPSIIQTFARFNLYGHLTNSTGSNIAVGTQILAFPSVNAPYQAVAGQIAYAQCVAFSGSTLMWMPLQLVSGAPGSSTGMLIKLGVALPNGYTIDLQGVTWVASQ